MRATGMRQSLIDRFLSVRQTTERLAAPLSPEDQQLQSMPFCSPTKWHRAHTTWFFETFILLPRGVPEFRSGYDLLFNSYYESAGPRHERAWRGLLSRPGASEIAQYRQTVDGRVTETILAADDHQLTEIAPVVDLGIAHEEQHQELLLTDILHAFSLHPHTPAYRPTGSRPRKRKTAEWSPITFQIFDGGLHEAGARGDSFCFDNELPRHRIYLPPFELASRLVTYREMRAFIEQDGYQTPSLWLSDGIEFIRKNELNAPLHCRMDGGALILFTLDGEREANEADPVAHLSYYEADALARFLGARLPTEFEWEVAATGRPVTGNLLEQGALSPTAVDDATHDASQLFGDVWEWTSSSYEPYPGFQPGPGTLGEYNGKFMVNQKVLRGGSCLTPQSHIRASYRNFWYPDTRFQMTGVRLAKDLPR